MYQLAKRFGYSKEWRTSKISDFIGYINNHINVLESSLEPIILSDSEKNQEIESQIIQINKSTIKSNIFISDIIQKIGEYLKDYKDVSSLKYTCHNSYNCNYTIMIDSQIVPYPLTIPRHYYEPIKGCDDKDVRILGRLNNEIRHLKLKYFNTDEIVINNYSIYDIYKHGYTQKYKKIILPNTKCTGYNDTDNENYYGGTEGTLYKVLYTLSNSDTIIECKDSNVHKLFELICIIKRISNIQIDLIKERLILINPDIRFTRPYYSLFNSIKLLSFKETQYSKQPKYIFNLDTLRPTFSSPIQINISDIIN